MADTSELNNIELLHEKVTQYRVEGLPGLLDEFPEPEASDHAVELDEDPGPISYANGNVTVNFGNGVEALFENGRLHILGTVAMRNNGGKPKKVQVSILFDGSYEPDSFLRWDIRAKDGMGYSVRKDQRESIAGKLLALLSS